MTSARKLPSNRFWLVAFTVLLFALSAGAGKAQPQSTLAAASPQSSALPAAESYPDNIGGLKQLAIDIVKAQQKTDFARAGQLLDTLVLPHFREWYSNNFTQPAAANVVPTYAAAATSLPTQLAGVFLNAYQEGFHGIEAIRYENEQSACSSPPVFSAMTFRRTQVPLYELRLTHGDQFKRMFAFAYVDGSFRLILIPDFSGRRSPASEDASDPKREPSAAERVRMGGKVAAAQLVCRANPYYPEEARRGHISGTVRLHAIIGKNGSIRQLDLITGPEPLVASAKAAVGQWRYRPTMINGEPVEVDTTIDVIYSLNY